jgi:hypothetical protein
LKHAYGAAGDIPDLLRQLESNLEEESPAAEPWFTLWSSLCHQGDVYSASFAAVPYVLHLAEKHATRVSSSFLQFAACVEFCRKKEDVEIPEDLQADYSAALKRIPVIIGLASERDWDSGFMRCAMSALAASKGFPEVAEAVLELDPKVTEEFMEWFYSR